MTTRADVRSALVGAALIAAAAVGVSLTRGPLAETVAKVKLGDESYPLPPAAQMPLVSLGYDAALADLVWAHVLVTQGLRLTERRRFDHAASYLDAIFALEPTYREPYLLADTILTFSTTKASEQDALDARRLLEQGTRLRPHDAKVHLVAGNFIAYIGPGLIRESEHAAWRLAGASLLLKAAELGAGDELQWHAIAGVGVLNRAGERDAAIGYLERTFALTDDAELRAEILRQLGALNGQAVADRAKSFASRFEQTWRDELPFVSRGMVLLLGPPADPYACSSRGADERLACARDFKRWAELQGPRRQGE